MGRRAPVVAVLPLFLAVNAVAGGATPARAAGAGDTLVTVGSPSTDFPLNKQNEPAVSVAIDPAHPNVVVSGSNDEIDNAPCAGTDCSFTPGISDNGVYFSFNGGSSYTEPTYTGWSARTGTAQVGPIGTVPGYFEKGIVGDGDPALAFGPRPGRGGFSWSNGSRLYYASLASNFPNSTTIKGSEAIAVARTDNVVAAAHSQQSAWMAPVIASKDLFPITFSDKDAVWADNASSSRFFGNAYVCWTSFGKVHSPIVVARSTDGGSKWSDPVKVFNAIPTAFTGPTGCTIRTDSHGTVYLLWFEDNYPHTSQQMMARSFDGGATFEAPRAVANVTDVGKLDPVHVANGDPRFTFDGIAGARTWSVLSVDIANGAPTGADATNEIAMTWSDGRRGLNHEQALLRTSTDQGRDWSAPVAVQQAGDRPDFPAVAISPNGTDVYLTYDAFLAPWRTTTASSRPMLGVVRHAHVAAGGAVGEFDTLHRGAAGDARASSENNLCCEFLGDYNYVAATRTHGVANWNDVRNAAVCPAIDAYRQSFLDPTRLPTPSPATDCAATFGNSDIYGGSYTP
ncbi:MAG: glycoside hydrolase [Candidatus Dormibacteraeota bacterium]|nr:glycoside hydrolase [Candidatus Dormibacteraeota bacterium]